MSAPSSLISTAGGDWLRPFHVERTGVRGVIARLGPAWRTIAAHGAGAPQVLNWLGQCQTAAALFAGDIKMRGSVSVQLRAPSTVGTLFGECTDAGTVRPIARTVPGATLPARLDAVGGDALLAITIERPGGLRYQGLVPLEGERLEQAFEGYFERSEQLPTAIRLAATDTVCAGMLLQQVPDEGGHGDRAPSADFERLGFLFRTVTDEELLTLAPETVLRRLFVEDDVRLQPGRRLAFACSCSRERVERVLLSLGEPEARAALDAAGAMAVRCEFCGQGYAFARSMLDRLCHPPAAAPGADRRSDGPAGA
ncbi:MAG: Hsp33 family molecular chaperone HslO [Pseudomonadota bacterium]